MGDVSSPHRSTTGPCDTLGRRYSLKVFPNRAARHSRATLQAYIVSQQFCATPSGNVTSLYRSTTGPRDTLGRHYCPKTFPNSSARHPRATLRHFFVAETYALIPSRISTETPSAPLGDITASKCSPTEPRDTLGRHYKPISFPNRAARHPWATLCHFFVAETYALIPSRINSETPSALPTPLGDITASKCSPTEPRGTLGRRYSP